MHVRTYLGAPDVSAEPPPERIRSQTFRWVGALRFSYFLIKPGQNLRKGHRFRLAVCAMEQGSLLPSAHGCSKPRTLYIQEHTPTNEPEKLGRTTCRSSVPSIPVQKLGLQVAKRPLDPPVP